MLELEYLQNKCVLTALGSHADGTVRNCAGGHVWGFDC